VAATKVVLGAAVEARVDPIFYQSSYVALLPPVAGTLTPDAPVGRPRGAYARSKAEAERVARAHQQAGAPITSLFPGTVWGPHDPGGAGSDSQRTAYLMLRHQTPFAFRGGIPIVDVRTVAAAAEAALEAGSGPRRYLLGGTFVTWAELTRILRGLTGRALPQVPMPLALAKLSGRLIDAVRPLLPRRPAFGFEGPWYLDVSRPMDDARTLTDLRIAHPPVAETIADQLRWMVAQGLVTARHAGALAAAPALLEGEGPATQVTRG
jgi:UDP-glucose 4-epimerase